MNPAKIAHLSWIRFPIEKAIELSKQTMSNITTQRARIESPPQGAEPLWFTKQDEALEASFAVLDKSISGIEAALDLTGCIGGSVLAKEAHTLAMISASCINSTELSRNLLAVQNALNIVPNFMGMVISGFHDSPGVLLKAINELRALRGVSPMSDESALPVSLSFAYKSPPLHSSECSLEDRERVFRGAAASFCLLYSSAMKGNGDKPWLEMRGHLRELQRVSNDPMLGCYWWVGEAIVDVIIADGLFMPPIFTSALRIVMVATQLLPKGEDAVKQSLTPAKFSALLNSLSISRRQTPSSEAVILQFDVKQNIEADQIASLQLKLTEEGTQSIASVVHEIKPRLEAAMASFGRAVNSKHAEGFKLHTQAFDQAMRMTANVFGIFNEVEISDLCFEMADMVKGTQSPSDFTPEVIEVIKTQILFLDAKINQIDQNEAAVHLQIKNVTPDVAGVIADVSYTEVKKVSHMIAINLDSGAGPEKLIVALESLRELACVYEFSGSLTIGGIMAAVVTAISDCVAGGGLTESEQLHKAARALAAIEMYLQYITTGLQPPLTLIEVAADAVRSMGINVADSVHVTQSELLAKFDSVGVIAQNIESDPLAGEMAELREAIKLLEKPFKASDSQKLNRYSSACLRLSAAALITGEASFNQMCRYAGTIAKEMNGRIDDPQYDGKAANALLVRVTEIILRCMDEYASKGKIFIFLIDSVDELAAFIGDDTQLATQRALSEVATSPDQPQEQALPDGFDPQLQSLFNEEFSELKCIILEFLQSDDLRVTDSICQAVHKVHGCSGSAGCTVIHNVFGALETRLYTLKSQGAALSQDQAEDLSDMIAGIAEYQSQFPWVTETAFESVWLETADSIMFLAPVNEQPSGRSALEVEAEAEADHYQAVVEPPASEVIATEPPPARAVEVEPSSEPEYDIDQHDIYLCDADDVIPELQQNVQSWLDDLGNKAVAVAIRRNMHTLKGAAAIINAAGIRTLTHHMESLFDAVASGGITADDSCAELVNFVLNEIITMSEAVRDRRAYRTPVGLINFVELCAEVYRVDADQLRAVIEAAYGAQPTAAPARQEAHSTPAADDDSVVQAEQPTQPDEAAATPEETPAIEAVDAHDSQLANDDASAGEVEADGAKGSRRGYRGKRGRAHGERQQQYIAKVAAKALKEAGEPAPQPTANAEPEYTEIETRTFDPSELVLNLIRRAKESENESGRSKKRSATSEKIKVELPLLDNSVQQANELKASSYRQTALYREMILGIVALREKMAVSLMHHNKFTVQLRHFNNMGIHAEHQYKSAAKDDETRISLERFNHLSAGNTQAGMQIEQMLQDVQDMIAQSHLMDTAFKHQTEVVSGLQRNLLRSRLVQFTNERPSINGALTSAIQSSMKQATLEFLGGDTLIDRQTLEAIRDPLRHIINNSVAHGLESPAERIALGKPKQGKITVKASLRAKALVIEIIDDGKGIDPEAIRAKAISSGLISPDDQLSKQELIYLITESGFSTAPSISELAGRGVGMDIVRSKVAEIGGQLFIRSTVGVGTTMELELPLTIGSNQALVCSVGDQWFAIPTFNMTQVLDYPSADLKRMRIKNGNATVEFEGKSFDVVHLADLIAIPDLKVNATQSVSHTPLVLIEQNDTRLAIEVEHGISMPEIHVTKFDGIMSTVKGIIGGTEIHDGTPALVLDVVELARLNLKHTEDGYKPKIYRIRRVRREVKPLVLIVDDSNSYRHLLTKHFEGIGWEVIVAVDGQNGIDKLTSMRRPSLFVTDMEMPRVNGIEFTEHLRSQTQYDDIQIIMLTTRQNIRKAALAAGVNQFLSKPYDANLLNDAIAIACPQLQQTQQAGAA